MKRIAFRLSSARLVRLRAPARVRLFVASRGTFIARRPLPGPTPELNACFRILAPLRDISDPRDQTLEPNSRRRNLPLRVARSSFAPRCARNNLLSLFAPRIIVPDPLLPARLAVLRTSWNHTHDAPSRTLGQQKNKPVTMLSTSYISNGMKQLQSMNSELHVDKTRPRGSVFTESA